MMWTVMRHNNDGKGWLMVFKGPQRQAKIEFHNQVATLTNGRVDLLNVYGHIEDSAERRPHGTGQLTPAKEG